MSVPLYILSAAISKPLHAADVMIIGQLLHKDSKFNSRTEAAI